MSPSDKVISQSPLATNDILRSIGRTLYLLLRLKVKEAQGERKLNEMILFLSSLGWRPTEVAEALGKTPNDVNPVISRARKATTIRKKPASKRK